ncbi:MAG: hypothetical protein COB81_04450 [Flavobacteriaceae bacterium]|nr:MAG: hypothetical protein COB81_04450 [Flavobacteriaceae bacterium]
MTGKLFKSRSHYVFDYKPRYYDERKERITDLEKKYNKDGHLTADEYEIELVKNNLRSDWVKATKKAGVDGTNLRLAIIISILVGIAAYILEIHTLF